MKSNGINTVMSEELNEMVGDLLSQLTEAQQAAKKVEAEQNPLKKENLEKFVVETAGALVEESLAMLKNVKDYIISSPESKDVASFSELVQATATALDALNKINLSDKKNDTIKSVKQMDIEARKALKQEDSTQKLLATREEVFKMLMDNLGKIDEAKTIDIKTIDT
jgi:hypothetical protein